MNRIYHFNWKFHFAWVLHLSVYPPNEDDYFTRQWSVTVELFGLKLHLDTYVEE